MYVYSPVQAEMRGYATIEEIRCDLKSGRLKKIPYSERPGSRYYLSKEELFRVYGSPDSLDRKWRLLGIADLAKRWSFSRQGIHNKIKKDPYFPEPLDYINNERLAVYCERDIADYEVTRKEFFCVGHKQYRQKKYWPSKYKKEPWFRTDEAWKRKTGQLE